MSKRSRVFLTVVLLAAFAGGAIFSSTGARDFLTRLLSRPIPTYSYQIINRWRHDDSAFTEGLLYSNGVFYESTGRNGASGLRIVDPSTGNIQTRVDLAYDYFGEGIALLNGKIFQLTWRNQQGFIYDATSLSQLTEFGYAGEGWGLTDDGYSLIMSNGSNVITFLDPQSFKVERTINVYDHDQPLDELNELEYVKGIIFANIWHSDKIVQIDPRSGAIVGWIDLTGLNPMPEGSDREAVLNGIAYDETNDRMFVTGKLWPWVFEIRLIPAPSK